MNKLKNTSNMENYEEKYKKALEWIRSIYPTMQGADKEDAEHYFPELKESEDERIRKEIIQSIKDNMCVIHKNKCLAWLEKQGEQNHTDKVESKFKVGDWITNGGLLVGQVTSFDGEYYHYMCEGIEQPLHISNVYNWHLWTIQDAKDGDVLASNRSIFIFSQEYMAGKPKAHCGIMNGLFIVKPEGCWTNEKCYPATKEQCDLLFQKMKDAGYEWDSEKKELRKIEQQSSDKAEPTEHNYITANPEFFQWIYDRLKYVYNENPNADYMLSLKKRIEDMQKPSWSEDDEKMFDKLYEILYIYGYSSHPEIDLSSNEAINLIYWLKSIKPNHWKPSEEQMSMLLAVLNDPNNITSESVYIALKLLYNDLKKL